MMTRYYIYPLEVHAVSKHGGCLDLYKIIKAKQTPKKFIFTQDNGSEYRLKKDEYVSIDVTSHGYEVDD